MPNKHRRRPPSPRTASTTSPPSSVIVTKKRVSFKSAPTVAPPRALPRESFVRPSLNQPLRSALREPPVARALDSELLEGLSRSAAVHREFGVQSPENRVYARGDKVASPRGRARLKRGRAAVSAPPRAPRRPTAFVVAVAADPSAPAWGVGRSVATRTQRLEEAPTARRRAVRERGAAVATAVDDPGTGV